MYLNHSKIQKKAMQSKHRFDISASGKWSENSDFGSPVLSTSFISIV